MINLINKLATEIAQHDYNELYELLEDVNFIDAYNKLGGFNLEMDKCTAKDELFWIQIRFDYNYKHINGTIFKTEKGGCELGETIAVWDDDYSLPIIDHLDLHYNK